MWQSLLHSGLFSVIGDYIAHLIVLLGADSRWDSNWSHLCGTRALCDAHFHPCSAPRSSVFSCLPAAVASQYSWSIWPLLSCKCFRCFLLILCLPEVFLPLQGLILSRFFYVCKICPSLLSVDGFGQTSACLSCASIASGWDWFVSLSCTWLGMWNPGSKCNWIGRGCRVSF